MGTDQLKELKRVQKENEWLRRVVSDPTLDELILVEAAKEYGQARLCHRKCINHVRERLNVFERRAYRLLQ